MNKGLQAGIAAMLSFLLHNFLWTNAFKAIIGNVFAEAFIFGGVTIAIASLVVVASKTISLASKSFASNTSPSKQVLHRNHFLQRHPLPSAALNSASLNKDDLLVSGSKSKARAKPSSTRTRFTS